MRKKINFDFYYDLIDKYEKNKYMNADGNKKGIVYTHRNTARYMLKLLNPEKNETIWEPSSGAGVFVFAILEYMIEEKKLRKEELKEYTKWNLYFSDIDKESIEFSKEILRMFFKNEFGIEEIILNAKIKDALLNEVLYENIVANPPYIRAKNLDKDYLSFLKNNFSFCKKGNTDIYYAFIEMINNFSNKSCIITPNSFLYNDSAKILRKEIFSSVQKLRNYKESKQFNTANIYTAIMVLDKKTNDEFKYADYNEEWITLNREKLLQPKWNLLSDYISYKYNDRNTYFKDIVDIYSGIATLADKYFILDKCDIQDSYYEKYFNGKTYLIEKEICIKYKKINKILGNKAQEDKYIIFPYHNINEIISESEIKENFPNAYQYLKDIKKILDNRDKGKVEKYDTWYAYGRRQGFNYDFSNLKVFIVPLVYKENNFIYKEVNEAERFIHSSGYVLLPKKGKEDMVKKLLQNEDFHLYLKLHGKIMSGSNVNYNRISATILKKYPY